MKVIWHSILNSKSMTLKGCWHVATPSSSSRPCLPPSKFNIMSMVTDSLTGKMGLPPILPIKRPITIGTMINLDGDCDDDGDGVGPCKQTLTWSHFSVFVPETSHSSGFVSIPTLCRGQLARWPITNTPLVTVTLRRFSTSPGLGCKSCFRRFFRTRNSTMCSELKYRSPAVPHTVPTTCFGTKWPFTRPTQFTIYRTRSFTLLFQRWSRFPFTKWFICWVTW